MPLIIYITTIAFFMPTYSAVALLNFKEIGAKDILVTISPDVEGEAANHVLNGLKVP